MSRLPPFPDGNSIQRTSMVERMLRRASPVVARRWVWAGVVRLDRPVISRVYLFLHPEYRSIRLTRSTALVIDGHSRSANSYAVCAFEQANPGPFRVTHHLHSPWVFERARELGVPALLLIRRPAEALASMMQFDPTATVTDVIDGYTGFYRRLLPILDSFVVADFHEVVDDFGSVLRGVNDRFGTEFAPYVKTDRSERAVIEAVELFSARHYAAADFEARVSRPSAGRADVSSFVAALSDPERTALCAAQAVYEEVLAARVRSSAA